MNNFTLKTIKQSLHIQRYIQWLIISSSIIFIGCSVNTEKDHDTQIDTAKQQSLDHNSTQTPTEIILSDLEKIQYKQAVRNINRNELNTAEKSLKQLLKNYPEHAGILSNLATIAYKNKDYSQAKKINTQALNISATEPLGLNLQGLLLLKEGEVREAEQSFLAAIKNDSDYALAHFNLAIIYDTYYQDLALAVKHYRSYLVLSDFEDEITKAWVAELELNLGG